MLEFVVEELSKSPEFEFVFGVELLPFPWFWWGEFWEDWLFWLEPLFDWDGGWEFWDCPFWFWDWLFCGGACPFCYWLFLFLLLSVFWLLEPLLFDPLLLF